MDCWTLRQLQTVVQGRWYQVTPITTCESATVGDLPLSVLPPFYILALLRGVVSVFIFLRLSTPFIPLLAIWISPFVKCCSDILPIYMYLGGFSLSCWFTEIIFIYSQERSPIGYMYCKYIFLVCDLPFYSLNGLLMSRAS